MRAECDEGQLSGKPAAVVLGAAVMRTGEAAKHPADNGSDEMVAPLIALETLTAPPGRGDGGLREDAANR